MSYPSFNRSKRSPNCPLIKSPFIKIKVEAKNLDKTLINSNLVFNNNNNNKQIE